MLYCEHNNIYIYILELYIGINLYYFKFMKLNELNINSISYM